MQSSPSILPLKQTLAGASPATDAMDLFHLGVGVDTPQGLLRKIADSFIRILLRDLAQGFNGVSRLSTKGSQHFRRLETNHRVPISKRGEQDRDANLRFPSNATQRTNHPDANRVAGIMNARRKNRDRASIADGTQRSRHSLSDVWVGRSEKVRERGQGIHRSWPKVLQ